MGLGRILHGAELVAGYLVDHLTEPIRMEDRPGQKDEAWSFDHVWSWPNVSVVVVHFFGLIACVLTDT